MDESAEQIAAVEASRRCLRRWFGAVRREQLESAVWPVLVVVAPVDAEHVLEMAAAEDEDPIETVGANRAHPPLGEGVCVRRLHWAADYLDALAAEDLIEGVAELRVAIVNEKSKRLLVTELHDEVARLLGDPAPSGLALQATYSIRRLASEIKKRR